MLEEQKLRHKLKQERKGTKKVKEAKMKDAERQDRPKAQALFSSLANKEGDYKKMFKKKKKS